VEVYISLWANVSREVAERIQVVIFLQSLNGCVSELRDVSLLLVELREGAAEELLVVRIGVSSEGIQAAAKVFDSLRLRCENRVEQIGN